MASGGIVATRRAVRRRGGAVAVGIAFCLWLIGVVLEFFLGGTLGGVVGFMFMVMALPVMPILGMPAAGGIPRLGVAILISVALWWIVGQVVAGRVSRHPIVGWREWAREFAIVGMGLWLGAAGGLLLGAIALGVF